MCITCITCYSASKWHVMSHVHHMHHVLLGLYAASFPLSQEVLDAALFEPGAWQPDLPKAMPSKIPAPDRNHLTTPCGLLFQESALLTTYYLLLTTHCMYAMGTAELCMYAMGIACTHWALHVCIGHCMLAMRPALVGANSLAVSRRSQLSCRVTY